jgi:hypothetical protein
MSESSREIQQGPFRRPVEQRTHLLATEAAEKAAEEAREFLSGIEDIIPPERSGTIVERRAQQAYSRVEQARQNGEMDDPTNFGFKRGIRVIVGREALVSALRGRGYNEESVHLEGSAMPETADELYAFHLPWGAYTSEKDKEEPTLEIFHSCGCITDDNGQERVYDGARHSLIKEFNYSSVYLIEGDDGCLFHGGLFKLPVEHSPSPLG